MVERIAYAVDGWGVGELVFAEALLAWYELPRPMAQEDGDVDVDLPLHQALVGRLRAYFAGARDDFGDVEIELEWCTPFQRRAVEAMRSPRICSRRRCRRARSGEPGA